jgi:glycosyltransferase involved in cell wall biosynthesis
LKRILIVQPYIPRYRREFFSLLRDECLKNGLELTIYAPRPDQDFSLRKDSSSGLEFIHEIGISRFKLLNRQLDFYRYPQNRRISDFDVVIMEQTLKNVQYPLALLRRLPKTKIALWGHGRTVVKEKSRFEKWLQLALSKRADFIFTYTSAGRDYLLENGFPESKIVALRNTNSSSARLEKIKKYESEKSLKVSNFHCCFIGAMESSKGLDMLFQALPIIKKSVPNFRFTFIGDGPDGKKVSELAKNSDYIEWLGFKNQDEIDYIKDQFSLILNPGRVGLIAVDSLMLQLPIVTMSNGFHAPEYEYIKENATSLSVSGSANEYALAVINLLNNPEDLQRMRTSCSVERENYTFDVMVSNFKDGIFKVLNQGNENV